MRFRYRRKRLSRADKAAAAATSFALGAGVAAVTFYLTRILLSRDPMGPEELSASDEARALPAGQQPSDDEPAG